MTRTDAHADSMSRRPPRRGLLRTLLALTAAMALVGALASPALAAEPTSGYTNTTTTKQEVLPTKTTTTPKKEVAPTKTTTTPAKSVEPTATTTTPTATTPKASTLPFTGLNLTWVVGLGLAMVCAGGSIVMAQRRQQRGGR